MKIRALILFAAIAVLGALNFSIFAKERIKRHGEIIFLELQPVDPRSLMQGDYMTLRFSLADKLANALANEQRKDIGLAKGGASEGDIRYAQIKLDSKRIATIAPPGDGTALKFRYRIRQGGVWLGTNAFFFEEGSAARFTLARYGEFRLDTATGEAVLTGLRDRELKAL
jgi:uncharacterized membrane-anchored protein